VDEAAVGILNAFYCAMLRRARLCHRKSSVRLSVCDVRVCFSTLSGWNTLK